MTISESDKLVAYLDGVQVGVDNTPSGSLKNGTDNIFIGKVTAELGVFARSMNMLSGIGLFHPKKFKQSTTTKLGIT